MESRICLLLGSLVLAFSLSANAGPPAKRALAENGMAGGQCTKCHEDEVASFNESTHFKAWGVNGTAKTCTSCHGDTEAEHMKSESKKDIVSFGHGSVQTAVAQSKQCLTCHENSRTSALWKTGVHARNDVTCASCHSVHKGRQAQLPSSEKCFTCHKDIRNDLKKTSHHPIIEGKVSCSDCHDPHGSTSHGNLRADNVNQLCYKCHGDKRGPFIWEHPPVEENCMTCHTAHGSSHGKLLVQKVPNLCQDCHAWSRHPGTPYTAPKDGFGTAAPSSRFVARSCQNCHTKIHGTTAPGNQAPSSIYNSGRFFLR